MDSARLLIDFGTLLSKNSDLRKILSHNDGQAELKTLCQLADEIADIGSILTPMHRERPDLYQFALFCAAFLIPVGNNLKLHPRAQEHLFLAALLQDCGQMIIATNTGVDTDTRLGHERHPEVSRKVIEKCASIPREVGKLIVSQHERHDGTGFQKGKLAPELNDSELALSVTNELVRIRLGIASGGTRNLANCINLLKLNQGHRYTPASRAAIRLIIESGLKSGSNWPSENIRHEIDQLLKDAEHLSKWCKLLQPLSAALGQAPMTTNVARCRLMTSNLQYAIDASGILDTSALRWVEHVRDEELSDHYDELEELSLLYAELANQFDWIEEYINGLADSLGDQLENKPKIAKIVQALKLIREERTRQLGEDDIITMDI